jgi:hypothetical protein
MRKPHCTEHVKSRFPDAINATTGTTDLFHAFTHIERTPEAVLEAGLGHATGIRAERKADKLQTESDQPSESRNRTSTWRY